MADKYSRLTLADYEAVASELGVDVASLKAVVDIEAGKTHKGFYAPAQPIINFDLSMFKSLATKRKISLAKYQKSHAVVFAAPNVKRYGSRQAAQYARLHSAETINSDLAMEATFWGMFQIGGFNWRLCGCESVEDFVDRMSTSEREQLELFAAFVKASGLLPALKAHDWARFARGYNGASYARRGYHKRLASAYAYHKDAVEKAKRQRATLQEELMAHIPDVLVSD